MTGRILVVDDDAAICRVLVTALEGAGFAVEQESRGEMAIQRVRAESFDAVLLDVGLPGMDGVRTCQELRWIAPQLSILMLSARHGNEIKVQALDAGADDYITKPFEMKELAARLRAAVRRTHSAWEHSRGVLVHGELEMDVSRRLVRKRGETIVLTPKEFDLLHYLMVHPGLPVPHARLLQAVWGPEYGSHVEYLRTFMRQLRKKVEDDPARPAYLLTDAYVGYRFEGG